MSGPLPWSARPSSAASMSGIPTGPSNSCITPRTPQSKSASPIPTGPSSMMNMGMGNNQAMSSQGFAPSGPRMQHHHFQQQQNQHQSQQHIQQQQQQQQQQHFPQQHSQQTSAFSRNNGFSKSNFYPQPSAHPHLTSGQPVHQNRWQGNNFQQSNLGLGGKSGGAGDGLGGGTSLGVRMGLPLPGGSGQQPGRTGGGNGNRLQGFSAPSNQVQAQVRTFQNQTQHPSQHHQQNQHRNVTPLQGAPQQPRSATTSKQQTNAGSAQIPVSTRETSTVTQKSRESGNGKRDRDNHRDSDRNRDRDRGRGRHRSCSLSSHGSYSSDASLSRSSQHRSSRGDGKESKPSRGNESDKDRERDTVRDQAKKAMSRHRSTSPQNRNGLDHSRANRRDFEEMNNVGLRQGGVGGGGGVRDNWDTIDTYRPPSANADRDRSRSPEELNARWRLQGGGRGQADAGHHNRSDRPHGRSREEANGPRHSERDRDRDHNRDPRRMDDGRADYDRRNHSPPRKKTKVERSPSPLRSSTRSPVTPLSEDARETLKPRPEDRSRGGHEFSGRTRSRAHDDDGRNRHRRSGDRDRDNIHRAHSPNRPRNDRPYRNDDDMDIDVGSEEEYRKVHGDKSSRRSHAAHSDRRSRPPDAVKASIVARSPLLARSRSRYSRTRDSSESVDSLDSYSSRSPSPRPKFRLSQRMVDPAHKEPATPPPASDHPSVSPQTPPLPSDNSMSPVSRNRKGTVNEQSPIQSGSRAESQLRSDPRQALEEEIRIQQKHTDTRLKITDGYRNQLEKLKSQASQTILTPYQRLLKINPALTMNPDHFLQDSLKPIGRTASAADLQQFRDLVDKQKAILQRGTKDKEAINTASYLRAKLKDLNGVKEGSAHSAGLAGGTSRSSIAIALPKANKKVEPKERRPPVTSPVPALINEAPPKAQEKPTMPRSRPSRPYLGSPYHKLAQVGEGTYGKVYKAVGGDRLNLVALKRIRMEGEKDGFPVTAMREIKLLQALDHPNIIKLHEMVVSKGSVYMVMQYMDHDLTGVLSQPMFIFSEAHRKSLCQQMLSGLAYLHRRGILHRDMKGSNILLNSKGELKLADFGLARHYHKSHKLDYTNRVITLWYRSPELLMGETVYGPSVDVWSAGCIMLELYLRKAAFQGNDEINQLEVIYKDLGTPNEIDWPGLATLPWYELVKPKHELPSAFDTRFGGYLSVEGKKVALGLLNFDPEKRWTAQRALDSDFFSEEEPLPELPTHIANVRGEWHEMESKHERARQRQKESIQQPTTST